MPENLSANPFHGWKTRERKLILHHSEFLSVEEHVVELHDGRVIKNWPWIITPDYINAVVMTESGLFLVFHQTKYGIEGSSLAPIGGYIRSDEDPLTAAKRELLEETGYEAREWIALARLRVDANRGAGMANLYFARGARRVTEPHSDDLEEQQLMVLSRREMETALEEGDFKVLAWATNVALALLYLENKKEA